MLPRILQLSPDLVYVYDLDERRNVFANRQLPTVLGYTQEELGQDFLADILHPEDLPAVVDHHERVRSLPDGAFRDLTYRARRRDGVYRWLLSRDSPFARGDDGRVTQILGLCRDITEERETRSRLDELVAELRQSNRELTAAEERVERERSLRERFFDSAQDAIVVADPDRCIVALNPAGQELFGYATEDVAGQPTAVLYESHAAFLAAGREHYHAGARDKSGDSFRVSYRRANGETFLGETTSGVIRDRGGIAIGFLGIIRDVTREVEAFDELGRTNARLSASLDTLDQFAYVASHDLRTPLRGIRHITNFLQEDLPAEALPVLMPRLEQLRDRVDRMDSLLVSLLEFVRSTEGAERREAVDLRAMLQAVETTLRLGDRGERELELRHDVGAVPPGTHSFPIVLELGLANLIANALMHHDGPVARVSVDAAVIDLDGSSHLEVLVQDDGPGVAPRHQERIFEVFRTLEGSGTTGMGLALTRRLAHRVGGSLTIDNQPGESRGASFRLRIPAGVRPDADR